MISSPANASVKLVRALQARRREREAAGAFVVEGVRLAEEAIRAGARSRLVLHTPDLDERGRRAVEALAGLGARVVRVSSAVMRAASDTRAPQGLLAVVPFPGLDFSLTANPFVVVLDRLADPGNLGTILRTADAAGVQAALLAPGTVDAFNPKVVRAGMGAHFRLPLLELGWEEIALRLAGVPAWLAEAGAGEPYDKVDWRAACALVIGAEAEGPSAQARAFAGRRVHIPMPGRAESLNAAVAAGVLLFEVARQRS